MKKGALILVLAALLALTAGCGTKKTESAPSSDEIALDTVVLTIDGREIPAWRYLCWLAYDCSARRPQS